MTIEKITAKNIEDIVITDTTGLDYNPSADEVVFEKYMESLENSF